MKQVPSFADSYLDIPETELDTLNELIGRQFRSYSQAMYRLRRGESVQDDATADVAQYVE